jgi:hypothetical protein
MSLLVATQITAVATAVLAAFAIITAGFAFLAFRKQSAEVATLQQQVKDQQDVTAKQTPVLELHAKELQASLDQRKLEAAVQRRAQASQVFIRMEQTQEKELWQVKALACNTSAQPIYDLHISWHKGTAPLDEADHLASLMHGDVAPSTRDLSEQPDMSRFGAVVFFRDSADVQWRVRPDGKLDEIPEGQGYPRSW